jgi:hypothetical protein
MFDQVDRVGLLLLQLGDAIAIIRMQVPNKAAPAA